jgi:hypothetical protein
MAFVSRGKRKQLATSEGEEHDRGSQQQSKSAGNDEGVQQGGAARPLHTQLLLHRDELALLGANRSHQLFTASQVFRGRRRAGVLGCLFRRPLHPLRVQVSQLAKPALLLDIVHRQFLQLRQALREVGLASL